MPEQLNINEILNLMKESNKEFESDVYVPSLNKEIHVKPMNASHLKNIIRTSVSGVFASNSFNQIVYSIFNDIVDPSIPLSSITNFDKVAILLQLRLKNVKPTVDVEVSKGDKSKKVSVSLEALTKTIKKAKLSFKDETVKDGSYEITLGYPTVEHEFLFDRFFETNRIKKIDENDKNALKDLFGPLFIQEITQYVKNIKIGEQNINLLTLPVGDRIAIVEGLSGSLITKVIETIDTIFGKQLAKILLVEEVVDGDTYEGSIEINASLFA